MGKRVHIGGHRGMGSTDHDFYVARRDVATLPVENTHDSIMAAYAAGCDYVECDAVMSADGVLFTLHNVVPGDHFFTPDMPPSPLNRMTFTDIEKFRTGRHATGVITPLVDTLSAVAAADPKTLPWAINIEIKGVQGAGQPYEQNDYIARLAAAVRDSGLAPNRVLFSSFALKNILAMSHALPQARFGMLFGDKPDARPIYADHRENPAYQYLPYDAAHAAIIMGLWRAGADGQARLGYFHPEYASLTADTVMLAEKHGAGINSWALFEEMTPTRRAGYDTLIDACEAEAVPLTIITDYIEAFR